VLTGCGTRLVRGSASPVEPPVTDVAPQQLRIVGAADDAVDRTARNALADLATFWGEQFPAVFNRPFTPLAGGYYSVDPDDIRPGTYPGGQIGCGQRPDAVAQNAFYCSADDDHPRGDAIQYDRQFLAGLAADHSPFIPALVMAHEFGHAVQARVGYPTTASINVETQADCFAGAWTRWVAQGHAAHSTIRPAELDDVLRGYLQLRDPVGTGARSQEAHGSYFDRVSAFQEGFDSGATTCRDAYGRDRQFTQSQFTTDEDLLTNGNASYDETVGTFVPQALPEFWTAAFGALGRGAFRDPTVAAFDRRGPSCAGSTGRDLVYCADADTVAYDRTDLARPVYRTIGDYGLLTAIAVPYALAARDQLGLSTDDPAAARSAVCLAGAFTQAVLTRQSQVISISPGDVDESVRFLLEYGTQTAVLGNAGLTGFQLVDVFRGGVFGGLSACDLR
jgi:Putative neutral zinc metallopeptidase